MFLMSLLDRFIDIHGYLEVRVLVLFCQKPMFILHWLLRKLKIYTMSPESFTIADLVEIRILVESYQLHIARRHGLSCRLGS
jgi:hypothetical protein